MSRVQGAFPTGSRPALFVTRAIWDTRGPNRSGIRAADAERHPLSGARVAPSAESRGLNQVVLGSPESTRSHLGSFGADSFRGTLSEGQPRCACGERNTVSGTDSGTPRTKWNRSQRFQLSPAGREAGLNYRQVIVASRAEAGRKSFDVARTEWAARLELEPTDGLYLGELLEAPRTIPEIAASLDGCGPQRSDVRAAVERLVQLRMLELVVPPPALPPPPRRW